VAPRPNATMRDSARECIYMTLPSGLCSAERVARYLGVDRRTLHRHLEREGDTFSSLLDAVRAPNRRPATLVTTTARSSQLRNYSASALSAFSRWFRGRCGCSVSQWRASEDGATAEYDSSRLLSA